jgi:tetratricopeptide (TPR) repeat protein
MRRLILAVACVGASCAPKIAPPTPVVTSLKYPDFVVPAVPSTFANTEAAHGEDRGWAFLQIGDLRNAEREFSSALSISPAFYPADASLGYVELARRDFKAALPHFDRSLQRQPADAAALVGRGQALVGLEREGDAVVAFQAALAADPSLADIARRIDVLRFRMQEQNLARGRQAARAGQLDDAIRAYGTAIVASPDSAFLYRELADVERQKGDTDAALDHFRRAAALDSTDARSRVAAGEILDARNDLVGAAGAYADALAVEANPDVAARLDAVRARADIARLPDEYRAIPQAPRITRADLAALIGVRLGALLPPPDRRDAVLVSDVGRNWASAWIIAVARAGVMQPFANHAFQPRDPVRRIDLAQAVSRLLARIAARNPNQGREWESARLKFSDLSPSHLAYVAASQAVASGVMKTGPDGSFQPSSFVSGQEAIDALTRLDALAGARPGAKAAR